MLYKNLLKPILFKYDAETVHDFFVNTGETLGKNFVGRSAIDAMYGYHGADISKKVDGIFYKTPIMLAAGFDYNARLLKILPSLAFGGAEVGSVTAKECDGNPKPRLERLPFSEGLLVNKGLKNDGVETIINRLKKSPKTEDFVIGISVAKTNDSRCADTQAAIDDYVESLTKLNDAGVGDYYTINISCPNAFGGETFTTPELLSMLLSAIEAIPIKKPLYVKMPINLAWSEFDSLLQVINNTKVKGIITGNLNKDYGDLSHGAERPAMYRGGISGKPCFKLSTELTRQTKYKYGSRFTIISCGGVMTPSDAMAKFEAGADLVQLVTGMVYNGPGLIKAICKQYAKEINQISKK
jgi:dihydroorotate dehydrogenase